MFSSDCLCRTCIKLYVNKLTQKNVMVSQVKIWQLHNVDIHNLKLSKHFVTLQIYIENKRQQITRYIYFYDIR